MLEKYLDSPEVAIDLIFAAVRPTSGAVTNSLKSSLDHKL